MARNDRASQFGLTAADVAAAVGEHELLRLLGMPRGRELEGELRTRSEAARSWYARHGRPFAAIRRIEVQGLTAKAVWLSDSELQSARLAEDLRATNGHAVVVLAVSAGREVAAEVARAWAEDRPDEAYFLDRFAAAVTEELVRQAAGAECRSASQLGETLLGPHSPGCGDFAIGDQHRLMALLGGQPSGVDRVALGPIELLPTGALDPPHSLLAALGVTRLALPATTPEALCRGCELDPCAYRRAPMTGARRIEEAGRVRA